MVAAEALARTGEIRTVKPILLQVIETGNPYEAPAVINALKMMARDHLMTGDEIRALLEDAGRTDLRSRDADAVKTL